MLSDITVNDVLRLYLWSFWGVFCIAVHSGADEIFCKIWGKCIVHFSFVLYNVWHKHFMKELVYEKGEINGKK